MRANTHPLLPLELDASEMYYYVYTVIAHPVFCVSFGDELAGHCQNYGANIIIRDSTDSACGSQVIAQSTGPVQKHLASPLGSPKANRGLA